MAALMCAWFARCDRKAVKAVEHPILGSVPCCQRCADFATSDDRSKQLPLGEPQLLVVTGAAVIGVVGLDDSLRMPNIERISMGRSEVGFKGTAHDLQQLVNELLDRTLSEAEGGYGCPGRERNICKRALKRFAEVGLMPQR